MVTSNVRGVLVQGGNNVVAGNNVRGSSPTVLFGTGVQLWPNTTVPHDCFENIVSDNNIVNCANGISISAISPQITRDNLIINNLINNVNIGIEAHNTAASILILGNVIKDNIIDTAASDGIRMVAHDSLFIDGNHFRNCVNSAMQITTMTAVSIVGNHSDGTEANFYFEFVANAEVIFEGNYQGNAKKDYIERILSPTSGNISTMGTTGIVMYSGTGALTLPNGTYIGQEKVIVMDGHGAGASIVVTPTNLNGATAGTFSGLNQIWKLMWNGTAWDSVFATCAVA